MGNLKASCDDASDHRTYNFFAAENSRRKSSFYLYIFLVWFIERPNTHRHTVITFRHLRSTCKRADCSEQSFCLHTTEHHIFARARIIELLTHYGFHVWIFYGGQIPHVWAPIRDCFRTQYLFVQRTPTMDRTMNVNYIVDAVDVWKCVRCEIESLNIDW